MKTLIVVTLIFLSSLSLSEDTSVPASLTASGVALFEKGRSTQASDMFYKALAYNDKFGAAYFYLGKISEKNGDKISASEFYSAAIKYSEGDKVKDAIDGMIRVNPLQARLKSLVFSYNSDLERIASSHQCLSDLAKNRKSQLLLSSGTKIPFSPVGTWMKANRKEVELKVNSNGTTIMTGVTGKWSISGDTFNIVWDKYWNAEPMKIISADLMQGQSRYDRIK